MKIFITGATGFVGTRLVHRLAQTEHQLRCLVRRSSQVKYLKETGAVLVVADLSDRDSLRTGMKGCDWVVNLANLYSFWEPDPRIYVRVNVEGTRNVMECALAAGVSKVVHVSSLVTYGKPVDRPFTEESPVGPVRFSEYARTKYAGDLIAWELHERKGLPLVVLYPGPILGAGDPKATGQSIANLVQRRLPAMVFPDSPFTYVYVGDVAEAIVRALEKGGNIGEKYLVGNERLSIRELSLLAGDIAGVPIPRATLPDAVAAAMAAILTAVANLTGKPPLWGLSTDFVRSTREGSLSDGSKAERELGITYTPIRVALEECVLAIKKEMQLAGG